MPAVRQQIHDRRQDRKEDEGRQGVAPRYRAAEPWADGPDFSGRRRPDDTRSVNDEEPSAAAKSIAEEDADVVSIGGHCATMAKGPRFDGTAGRSGCKLAGHPYGGPASPSPVEPSLHEVEHPKRCRPSRLTPQLSGPGRHRHDNTSDAAGVRCSARLGHPTGSVDNLSEQDGPAKNRHDENALEVRRRTNHLSKPHAATDERGVQEPSDERQQEPMAVQATPSRDGTNIERCRTYDRKAEREHWSQTDSFFADPAPCRRAVQLRDEQHRSPGRKDAECEPFLERVSGHGNSCSRPGWSRLNWN